MILAQTGGICDDIEEQCYKYLSLPIVGIECCGAFVLE